MWGSPPHRQGEKNHSSCCSKSIPPKVLPGLTSVSQAECFYSIFQCVLKNTYRMLKIFILKEKLIALMEQHMYLFSYFNEENVLHAFRKKRILNNTLMPCLKACFRTLLSILFVMLQNFLSPERKKKSTAFLLSYRNMRVRKSPLWGFLVDVGKTVTSWRIW